MIKKVLKAIDVAFSMYSKIPMPRFNWDSEDMKYHLIFFPWVGAVIGLIEFLFYKACISWEFSEIFFVMGTIAIPLLITGGFHVDGYMDTMDAIHSYQPKEKKLEILKDPHIGAFSVICLLVYMLIAIGCVSELREESAIKVMCTVFFASRALSGLSLMYFKNAKETGMLNTSKKTADKKCVCIFLWLSLTTCVAFMIYINLYFGIVAIASLAASFFFYYKSSYKNFGGITGDQAGFYVCISEITALVLMTVCKILICVL